MAVETSLFFDALHDVNGNLIRDELGDPDRLYSSKEFAQLYRILYGNGIFLRDGTTLGTALQVVGNLGNMYVRILIGNALINGRVYELDESDNEGKFILIQPSHPVLSRKDIVVLGLNLTTPIRDTYVYVKTGAPNSNPQEPELQRDNDIYELKLASITVRAGTQSINQADIQDKRGVKSVCGTVTGNFPPLDLTGLYAQMDDWLARMKADSIAEWFDFMRASGEEFRAWKDEQLYLWVEWVQNLRGLLAGDVAGSLALGISDLQRKVFLERDMDNHLQWPNGKWTTTFSGTTITTTITNAATGLKMAERVSTEVGNSITTRTIFFESNGVTEAMRKTFRTDFSTNQVVTVPV